MSTATTRAAVDIKNSTPNDHRLARRSGDLIVATAVVLIGIGYGAQAVREGLGAVVKTGPGFFPLLVAVVMVVSGMVVVIHEVRLLRQTRAVDPDASADSDPHWMRIGGILVTALAVPAIGPTVGFVVTLSSALVVMAKIMGMTGWARPVALGVIFGIALWGIFITWLFVPLPSGTIGLL